MMGLWVAKRLSSLVMNPSMDAVRAFFTEVASDLANNSSPFCDAAGGGGGGGGGLGQARWGTCLPQCNCKCAPNRAECRSNGIRDNPSVSGTAVQALRPKMERNNPW